jgi:hypothetical protein
VLQESKKRSLSLSNVAGVFYILISGLVLAIVLGLVEIYHHKRKNPGQVSTECQFCSLR